ncbi:MAG: hypothetical protein A6D91_04545 [Bacillaceae bacterium G1]|nr:hypothetical protein [Bacillota bacterium]OJF17051.1 MAG: hypothetical protein A6D91_04545 [Bacillaceae bacterium G1]
MNDFLLIIIAAVFGILAWWEWSKFHASQKKEKAAFLALMAIGAALTAWLIFFPETPGPNEWVEKLLRPLGTRLETQ